MPRTIKINSQRSSTLVLVLVELIAAIFTVSEIFLISSKKQIFFSVIVTGVPWSDGLESGENLMEISQTHLSSSSSSSSHQNQNLKVNKKKFPLLALKSFNNAF